MPDSYKTGILPTIKAIVHHGTFHRKTDLAEGAIALYRGNWTHMVKKVPFSALKFLSYEYFKQVSVEVIY